MALIHGVELKRDGDMVHAHKQNSGREFEPESIAAWAGAGEGIYIDIGAYSGLYAIHAAKRGHRVLAFEPNPIVFDRLLENIETNGVEKIEAHKIALSDKTGSALLSVNSTPLSSGGSLEKITAKQFNVKTSSLDRFIQIGEKIAAIKIDVEGHEIPALAGAIALILNSQPLVITEALDPIALKQQTDFFNRLGYNRTKADEHNYIWKR